MTAASQFCKTTFGKTVKDLELLCPDVFKNKYVPSKDKDLYFSKQLHVWSLVDKSHERSKFLYFLAPFLFAIEDLVIPDIIHWAIQGELIKMPYQHWTQPDEWTHEQRCEMMRSAELVMRVFLAIHSILCSEDAPEELVSVYQECICLSGAYVVNRSGPFEDNLIRFFMESNATIAEACTTVKGEKSKDVLMAAFFITSSCYSKHEGSTFLLEYQAGPAKEKEADQLKSEGSRHYKSKEYTKAITSYSKAIKLCPTSYILYGNRAQAYLEIAKYREAEWDASRAVILNPNWTKGIFRFALSMIRQGRNSVAKEFLDKYLSQTFNPSQQKDVDELTRLRAQCCKLSE